MADFLPVDSTTFKTVTEEIRETIVGDSKESVFCPCIEVRPWEDDDCLKIWKDTSASLSIGSNLVDKERLTWQDNKEFWTISPLGIDKPDDIKDDFHAHWNGAQFVIRLDEKPKIDPDGYARFIFQMSGHKDLLFFHQPEFTQEEIDLGGRQPDWVIDSVAVYHKSK